MTPVLAGWLASGSCYVAGCYEDCDPCLQQCRCTSQCTHGLAGPDGLRIVAFESRVEADGEGRSRRVLRNVLGPALDLAAGPGPHGAEDLARFARGILAANPEFFPTRPDARWVLDAVELFETAGVVSFHHDSAPSASDGFRSRHTNSVSLLFDRRGRLVEVDQAFARGTG